MIPKWVFSALLLDRKFFIPFAVISLVSVTLWFRVEGWGVNRNPNSPFDFRLMAFLHPSAVILDAFFLQSLSMVSPDCPHVISYHGIKDTSF